MSPRDELAAKVAAMRERLSGILSTEEVEEAVASLVQKLGGLALNIGDVAVGKDDVFVLRGVPAALPEGDDITLKALHLVNFKHIPELTLDLTHASSSLSGDWTCIAGINGAGKSSILQALAMLHLGDKLAAELGGERIRRMLRRVGSRQLDAELTLEVEVGSEPCELYLPLGPSGIDTRKLSARPDHPRMVAVWERLKKQVLVSYGASRNLSEYRDSRFSSLSLQVQRQMTLFDPLTQIASVDVLLEGNASHQPILVTLRRLLKTILEGELAPQENGGDRLTFTVAGGDIETLDLPDGFRSTIAWLADLCTVWHRTAPVTETATSDPGKITGTVLLDEIDLHLHPRLQRALIPRLRAALPGVRFVVTSHSPLVLGSFDRSEFIILDRHSEGGVKALDRQIFGFTTDQIYDWLMDTPPQSQVLDDKLKEGTDPDLALYFQSQDKSEDQARAELEDLRRLRDELLKNPAS